MYRVFADPMHIMHVLIAHSRPEKAAKGIRSAELRTGVGQMHAVH